MMSYSRGERGGEEEGGRKEKQGLSAVKAWQSFFT